MFRMRTHQKAAIVSTLAAVLAGATASGAASNPVAGNKAAGPITVTATPVPSFNRFGATAARFGKLDYLGGVSLSAPGVEYFGGWSGLALDADGKGFTAVSDRGVWMTGALTYANGVVTGIDDARLGPLLSLEGKPLRRSRDRDAEAVALVSGSARNGAIMVAFEQNSRLVRYDMSRDGVSAARSILERPAASRGMRANQGFEAMTVMKGGPFRDLPIAISERYFDKDRNHTGWIWTANGPQLFHLANIGDFDVTDIASLDDGTLFVLERRFRWLEGVKMRIRRISAADLKPGKTVDAGILLEANMEYQIDNMEALAVTRGRSGEIILTVMSDDNYNRFLQRTLLLQFALTDAETAKARPQR